LVAEADPNSRLERHARRQRRLKPEVLVAFRTEQQAREHCPNDTIVWVDPQSGGYHLNTSPLYGHSGSGRYACHGEAELADMRAMAN
jgi:hypothetical protein